MTSILGPEIADLGPQKAGLSSGGKVGDFEIVKESFSDPNLTVARATRAETDDALVDSWLGTFDPEDSRGTLVLYRRVQGRFFTWMFARGLTLRSLKVEDLTSWKVELTGSQATKATTMSVIKSLFGYGHRTGYLTFNVAAAVKTPKVAPDPDARSLTEMQVASMVHEARKALTHEERRPRPRFLDSARRRLHLILWMYYSGCRVAEVAAARWEDLHMRSDGDFNLSVLGKGRKRRTVPMPKRIIEEIARATLQGKSGPVFPLGPRQIQAVVTALAEQAGIDLGVSPHWIRHAHASHAVDRGAPIHTVQGSLGHSSLSTTGRYLHRGQDGAGRYLAEF